MKITRRFVAAVQVYVCTLFSSIAGAMPIGSDDIVVVDGREWAQVDLFTNLSWFSMNQVCPGGSCGDGALNGYEMTGWRWSSLEETNALFNYYLTEQGYSGEDLLGPGADSFSVDFPGLLGDTGFRATDVQFFGAGTFGWTSTLGWGGYTNAARVVLGSTVQTRQEGASSAFNPLSSRGGWFYRDSSAEVPLVPTPLLILAGLAMLSLSTRQQAANLHPMSAR
ncbi:MAG: hypothetical protein AAGA91_07790 [Pseudomonadota bacterium]